MVNQLGYTKTDLSKYRTINKLQGFDYEDTATGFNISVRKDSREIRINGVLISLEELQDFLDRCKEEQEIGEGV